MFQGSGANPLPPGWEKHEDSEGAYYWHVKSGTIQRQRPEPAGSGENEDDSSCIDTVREQVRSSRIFDDDFDPLAVGATTSAGPANDPPAKAALPSGGMSKSCTASSIVDLAGKERSSVGGGGSGRGSNVSSGDLKRRSMPPKATSIESEADTTKAIKVRTLVRSRPS